MRKQLMTLATVGGLLAVGMVPVGAMQAPPKDTAQKEAASQANEAAVRMADTVDEHLAIAAKYAEKAVSLRREAREHRAMLAAYKEQNSALANKAGAELPWVAKMRKHCEGYFVKADALAAEADRFAEFHRMRAAELQGK